jgi:hypothetical protein
MGAMEGCKMPAAVLRAFFVPLGSILQRYWILERESTILMKDKLLRAAPNSMAGGSRGLLHDGMESERGMICEVIELFSGAFVSVYGHE